MQRNLLNEEEAAAYLNLKPATLRTWRCREVGPAFYRIGGIKYAVEDLEAYKAASRHVPSVRASVERVRGNL